MTSRRHHTWRWPRAILQRQPSERLLPTRPYRAWRWGESIFEDHQAPPAVDFPAILQRALRRFQDKEVVENLGGNLLQDRVAQSLGDFLIASSLVLSKVQDTQDSQAEIAKLREELTLQAKTFSKREMTIY